MLRSNRLALSAHLACWLLTSIALCECNASDDTPTSAADTKGIAVIQIDASRILHPVSRYLTGACIEDVNHEIYGGIYSQMIFGESFQEPAPPEPIAGFQTFAGDWSVHNDELIVHGTDGPKLISTTPEFRDGRIGVDIFLERPDGINTSIIARVSKPGVGADNFVGYEIALDSRNQCIHFSRHRMNWEPILNAPCNIQIGKWISLEAKLTGDRIEVFVDGKQILDHKDGENALGSGSFGLRSWHHNSRFKNLWYEANNHRVTIPFQTQSASHPLSRMWTHSHTGSAQGTTRIETETPFTGEQSQIVEFLSGSGEYGVSNRSLNRWGMNLEANKPYNGYVWVKSPSPCSLKAILESTDGKSLYADTTLKVTSAGWQRIDFQLTPNRSDTTGQFSLRLNAPSVITLGHVYLSPGDWGLFKGLPVRKDVAVGLINEGITVLRYGGSMINNDAYRWKKMIGPRDRRPPYKGFWYPQSTNGWGIIDFMNLCEASGFEYIPAFCMSETPQDMADFVQYATGAPDNAWAKRRIEDGHPEAYRLKYIQLGNEERIDDAYYAKFEKLAEAIWQHAPDVILVVGDFLYVNKIDNPLDFRGAASNITSLAAHQKILQLAKKHDREVWFDIHLFTERLEKNGTVTAFPSFVDALEKIAGGAKHKVAVFELNSNSHSLERALSNVLAIHAIERDGRIPVCSAANCLQPDGQNDNGWNQGLLFLSPDKVWLQPTGYIEQMMSQHWQPHLVQCIVQNDTQSLDVTAKCADDGSILTLQIANTSSKPTTANLQISGTKVRFKTASVTELAGELSATNTRDTPNAIVPKNYLWSENNGFSASERTFPPHSFTVIEMR